VIVWATTVVNCPSTTVQGVVEQSLEACTVSFADADPTHRHAARRNSMHLSGYKSLFGNSESFEGIKFSLPVANSEAQGDGLAKRSSAPAA
jgi:hypothetical protein